jgi:hypothetical protein
MRPHAKKHVNVIRHAVNGQQFVLVCLNYTGNVFEESIVPCGLYKCESFLDTKDRLNVNLCVSVWHSKQIIWFRVALTAFLT